MLTPALVSRHRRELKQLKFSERVTKTERMSCRKEGTFPLGNFLSADVTYHFILIDPDRLSERTGVIPCAT
ncbi:hypothetical protein J6590_080917 [Homalodisca vitripennis]|nr:hypothetical protein J6590_080917 [Homalodisca vitripennis]